MTGALITWDLESCLNLNGCGVSIYKRTQILYRPHQIYNNMLYIFGCEAYSTYCLLSRENNSMLILDIKDHNTLYV